MSIEHIEKYFTPNKNFIKPIKKNYALTSKNEFIDILKWWSIITKSDRIGDLKEMNNNTPLIFLKIGSSVYKLNADSTKTGVKEFLKNKATNNNSKAISGFYFYKEI